MKFLVTIRVHHNDIQLLSIVILQDLDEIGSRTLTTILEKLEKEPENGIDT
jgi:hypothetical protein